jgi:hypothetical protein
VLEVYQQTFFSWAYAGFFPYLVVFILSLGLLLFRVETILVRIVKYTVILTILGFQFYLFPIYANDWLNEFDEQIDQSNMVVKDVYQIDSNFSGIVVLASPFCSYCHELGIKARLTAEKNQINYRVFLNQTDTTGREFFSSKSGIEKNLIQPVSDLSAMQALTLSWYPVVIQFKKGKPTKRWWYRNMGYPAWDFIVNQ